MPSPLDTFSPSAPLRGLLARYRDLGEASPDVPWHDRVMELAGIGPDELSKLHGILLAKGWLDTRVDREALATPGRLRACYRATREGIAALRVAESPTDWDEAGAEAGADPDMEPLPLSDDSPPPGEPSGSGATGPW